MSSKLDSFTQPSAMHAIFARHAHEQSSMENTGIGKKTTERRGRNLDLILEEGRKGRGNWRRKRKEEGEGRRS